MDNFAVLEQKISRAVAEIKRLRDENKFLVREHKRLESQCHLLEEENSSARKVLSQNGIFQNKQKKVKERIERLWEQIAQAL